jgi:hypothetical protein
VLLELGPVPSATVVAWTRFARRMLCELRVEPSELADLAVPDLVGPWAQLIDAWAAEAGDRASFRWSGELDEDLAEYLLHGYQRFLRSTVLARRATRAELGDHRAFSLHVAQAFVDGLAAEGRHLAAAQAYAALGSRLDH